MHTDQETQVRFGRPQCKCRQGIQSDSKFPEGSSEQLGNSLESKYHLGGHSTSQVDT